MAKFSQDLNSWLYFKQRAAPAQCALRDSQGQILQKRIMNE